MDVETLTGTVASIETKNTPGGVMLEFWVESGADRSPARVPQTLGRLVREGARLQLTGRRDHNGVLIAERIEPAGTEPGPTGPGWWSVRVLGMPRWMAVGGTVVLLAIVAAIVLYPDPPPPPPRKLRIVGKGTVITVKMSTSLSSQTSRQGDRFEATIVTPIVKDNDVLLPAGTVMGGTILAIRQAGINNEGRMALDFDAITLNALKLPIRATVLRVIGPAPSSRIEIRDRDIVGRGLPEIVIPNRGGVKPFPRPRHAVIVQGDELGVRIDDDLRLPG